jgi:predicted lipid-binding transport protein (Tim44 family)
VIDQKPKTNGNAGNPGNNSKPQGLGGMLGGLGNFFKHLFGF